MLLHEYKLSIPVISMKDWLQAVEMASGLMRDVLDAQTKGLKIMATIDEPMASTERIGWLNLWSKNFAVLEAVSAALSYHSRLVLLLCQRNSFELMLQMHAVMEPFQRLQKKEDDGQQRDEANEYACRSCVNRLRAYTAWCLWHDKAYFKEVLNPKSLRTIWNTDLLEKQGQHSFLADQFLKKIGRPLDEKFLREGSRNVRQYYTEKIRQIDEWMADPLLRKWSQAIEVSSKKNIVGVPFFMLFDRADVSIPKRLLKEGLRHCYSSYILASMASHGSSMEEFIEIESPSIKPLLAGDMEQINLLAPEVIFRCRHLFTLLEIINDEMLKNPQIRV